MALRCLEAMESGAKGFEECLQLPCSSLLFFVRSLFLLCESFMGMEDWGFVCRCP